MARTPAERGRGNFFNMFTKFLTEIKNILFPVYCVECQREGEWWCQKCQKKIPELGIFLCPICSAPTTRGICCTKCAPASFLYSVSSLLSYQERGASGKLIKDFKFHLAKDIESAFANLIVNNKEIWRDVFPSEVTIIPVPLHPRRERERGYNQAKILAREFCKVLQDLGVAGEYQEKYLLRQRYTFPQSQLSAEARRENVKEAFVWEDKNKIPEKVILVDDVFTTGATMQECAKVLCTAGVKEVWGWTLARD